jgi:hypothetical protein
MFGKAIPGPGNMYTSLKTSERTLTTAYAELLSRSSADPDVLGLVLTGSHARGMPDRHSDHDVFVVVDDPARWTPTRRPAELDEIVCTLAGLADTSDEWQRYAFRGAQIVLDRTDGKLAGLVAAQAALTPDEADSWSRDGLDGYVNMIYRAAKNRRGGEPVLARLEEMESVSWFMTALFAMHGRVRPYNKYLRWELTTYPLGSPWDADTLPERVVEQPSRLFTDLEQLARAKGYGDVLDSWGTDLDLLR